MIRRSWRTALAVAVVFVAVVAGLVWVSSLVPLLDRRPGPAHPEPNPTGGYTIEVAIGDEAYRQVSIDKEGGGCDVLEEYTDTYRTCLIATNLIPSLIGGEAYGRLNEKRTPALDALVWRARADDDVTVCERGGLEGAMLELCRTEAQDPGYVYEHRDVRVQVPTGGAAPDD